MDRKTNMINNLTNFLNSDRKFYNPIHQKNIGEFYISKEEAKELIDSIAILNVNCSLGAKPSKLEIFALRILSDDLTIESK